MTDKPAITQAMIDAYDEYTHLTLDRRGFMQKLTHLAGSGAAAAVIMPMLAASPALAAKVAADDARIRRSEVPWPAAMGDMNGYLVRPAEATGKLPAVIVIHENRGLNEHIRDVARRMALEGFMAFAPDFLSAIGGTPTDEDKAREMISQLEPVETVENAVSAADWLAARDDCTGATGAIGFCWGGGLVNSLAAAAPDNFKAGAAYYGRQAPADKVPGIKAALMLHYAGLDDRINAGIEDYRKALEAGAKDFTIHLYEGVNHAFNNDTSAARYDEKAAALAWERTVAFLKENLGR